MEKFYSLRELATQLSVSVDTLKRLHRKGRLRVVRLGCSVRVTESEVRRLCAEEFVADEEDRQTSARTVDEDSPMDREATAVGIRTTAAIDTGNTTRLQP